MAKLQLIPQNYPRTDLGLLDDSALSDHSNTLSISKLKEFIRQAIKDAQRKSSRAILSIRDDASQEAKDKVFKKHGHDLFKYFQKYVSDPAAMAHQIHGMHYENVAREQFRNRTLQKERMNSGWRYQFLAVYAAQSLSRFQRISDIGAAECDFNAIVKFKNKKQYPDSLRLYVSVKNRSNTMGGQDWPKAIAALEKCAKSDRNGSGPYCCVFGIAIERGNRTIRRDKNGHPYSSNTEVWLADFFWPFFSTYSYEQIMRTVLDVLMEGYPTQSLSTDLALPNVLLNAFGEACRQANLIDSSGKFNDPHKLVSFFVQSLPKLKKRKTNE